MSEMEYTYAVARIRALEVSLFSKSVIEQLMACTTYESALAFITEKGWGNMETAQDADAVLAAERSKIWDTIRELGVPMTTFDVLSYPNVFHNLKTAIKEVYMNAKHDEFYFEGTVPSREEMREVVEKKEFFRLPESMQHAAEDAYETLTHSGDGQLCDVIIDQACLNAIYEAGKKSKADIIKRYVETTLAVANIKIAVRCQKTGKSAEFMNRAMSKCDSFDTQRLSKAALSGFPAICDYLSVSGYGEAAECLQQSPSAFERWCDNYLIEMMKPEKYHAFSVGPLVAYVLARENEIKTVGIILSGKLNGLNEESIRERIREMYV